MRLVNCNQTYKGKTPLISAIHFWAELHLQVLIHWKYYRNKMFLLDQPNTFLTVILLLYPILSTDAWNKPALAWVKSRLIANTQGSCSFSPCLSIHQVCSPCWLLTHPRIHIRTLQLLLMFSAVFCLLDQCKRQQWFSLTSPCFLHTASFALRAESCNIVQQQQKQVVFPCIQHGIWSWQLPLCHFISDCLLPFAPGYFVSAFYNHSFCICIL